MLVLSYATLTAILQGLSDPPQIFNFNIILFFLFLRIFVLKCATTGCEAIAGAERSVIQFEFVVGVSARIASWHTRSSTHLVLAQLGRHIVRASTTGLSRTAGQP